jgi:hypothetical protein
VFLCLRTSVVDPDPAFQVNPDPDSDPGFIRPKLEDKKIKKIVIYRYLSLGLHKESPSYRRTLQPSEGNIQHFKNEIY